MNNSPEELHDLKSSIPQAAKYAGVPPAFFLAMMMQESDGCVRVGTTSNAVTNPGLMQSNNGEGNCYDISPCPPDMIKLMLMDGAGQGRDFGLQQALTLFEGSPEPAKFYRAARAYNAGPNGVIVEHLEFGGATRCYASDIANRLLGWTHRADRACPFDGAINIPSQTWSSASALKNTPTFLGTMDKYSSATSTSTLGISTSDSNRPLAPGIHPQCKTFYLVQNGDNCKEVARTNGISVERLRELNTKLDVYCTNLWLGYSYCIAI